LNEKKLGSIGPSRILGERSQVIKITIQCLVAALDTLTTLNRGRKGFIWNKQRLPFNDAQLKKSVVMPVMSQQ
jgi:hypothetical protein